MFVDFNFRPLIQIPTIKIKKRNKKQNITVDIHKKKYNVRIRDKYKCRKCNLITLKEIENSLTYCHSCMYKYNDDYRKSKQNLFITKINGTIQT